MATSLPRPMRVPDDELVAFAQAVNRHFYEDDSEEAVAHHVSAHRSGYRAWVVRDRGRIIANLGVIETDLSLPGGARLPVAAVTAVGVAQTSRRRGLLRALMAAAHDEAVAHGEPVAALFASETPIYGRFGYGATAPGHSYTIKRAHTRFRTPADTRLVQPVEVSQARATWPALHDAWRDQRGGAGGLSAGLWQLGVEVDPPSWRGGSTARQLVEIPGRAYARYRLSGGHQEGLGNGEVSIIEFVALDPEAEAALWQYLCDLDLTARITLDLAPPDDALPAMVTEPMALGMRPAPALHTRILDLPRALATRSYDVADTLVLQVHDAGGYAEGSFRLDASPAGAEVARCDADAQLILDIEDLSAVWLGGVRTSQLVAAGRVRERQPGAAARLDRLLHVPRAPFTNHIF